MTVTSSQAPSRITGRLSIDSWADLPRYDARGLLGLAAALVVLGRAHVPGLAGSTVGIDLVLVVVGFSSARSLLPSTARSASDGDRPRVLAGYARGVARLLPTLAVVVGVTLMAERLVGGAGRGPASSVALSHLWLLGLIAQLVLPLPLLFAAASLMPPRARTTCIGVVAAAVAAASFYGYVQLVAEGSVESVQPIAAARSWEFAAGVLVAALSGWVGRCAARGRLAARIRSLTGAVGLAMIGAATMTQRSFDSRSGISTLLPVAGCCLLLAAGAGSGRAPGATRLLQLRPLQWLGRLAYPWYAWQGAALALAPAALGYHPSWIRELEISLLCLWLAGLTWALLERPTGGRARPVADAAGG